MRGMGELSEQAVLEALKQAGPMSARELGLHLNVRGHDALSVLSALLTRGLVTVAARDPSQEISHTNPRVYAPTDQSPS